MIVNCMRLLGFVRPLRYSFSTGVTKDQLNYYNILQVDESATEQSIRRAYTQLTRGLIPEIDTKRFKELSQALVILTDGKTRDAYDSLLKVRKAHYLSAEEQTTPSTRSLLSLRRQDRLQQLRNKLNIDQFGRYKGGLPNKYGQLRSTSRGEPGEMHHSRHIQEELDNWPEFNNVTADKAESFKNFHQNEREARQMKWPWFSFQVDYDFFTFRTFRKGYWPKIQLFILFFYIIPTLCFAVAKFQKQQATQALKQNALKKAQESGHKQSEHVA